MTWFLFALALSGWGFAFFFAYNGVKMYRMFRVAELLLKEAKPHLDAYQKLIQIQIDFLKGKSVNEEKMGVN